MSEQGAKPEVLPGDLITRPGLYESRSQGVVEVRDCGNGYWEAAWEHEDLRYHSSGERVGVYALDDPYQLLHWVGPLPASEPEPETTTEQLAEIEGQGADTPATEYTPPNGWRVLAVGERLRDGDVTARRDGYQYPTERVGGWVGSNQRYIRLIEPEPQPEPIQVREGRWRTRGGDIRNVTPTPEGDGRKERYPWWDGQWLWTWTQDGRYFADRQESPLDLVEYLGPLEQQPRPVPQPPMLQDADERIRLLKQANDAQAETIERLQTEARDLNMEIGGLERRLSERDARIRDLETIYSAATKSFEDANRANDALRAQVRILQQEADKKNSRIEFLETLNAGNGAAIDDYRAKVEKLQGLVDTARGQLEAAATERDELRAAIDAADKQLDQKDAQIRDLRIELEAAQQVPQPVSDEERERIWDEATEQAGRQVMRWLRPLIAALNKQPNERFQRFMALTLSVLPDLLPELLGYAVEDESLDSDENCE